MTRPKKKSFLLYCDKEFLLKRLTDEQTGRLFRAIYAYADRGEEPDPGEDVAVLVAFDSFKQSIDANAEEYAKRCEINQANGRKGGKAKAENSRRKEVGTANIKEKAQKEETEKESIDYQQIVDMYNETCKSLPRVHKLNAGRKNKIKSRLKAVRIEDIREAFKKAEESDFLTGKNERGWKASFDWLMEESNMTKVLEENYKNTKSKTNASNNMSEQMNRYGDINELESQLLASNDF